jgi:protein-L-isoaspartate(D-aspartate) O-methyltransferase
MSDLSLQRRFFAEEVQIACNIQNRALLDALAEVSRERFLGSGPWVVRGEADLQGPLRRTPGDDPRFVYHNVSIGIDPSRMLFNGAPGQVCTAIEALALERGARVLHLGAGTGYYTAVIGHVVGREGHVVGIEVDDSLAARAGDNLGDMPWVSVQHGDGSSAVTGRFDAILVNAGVTHPEPWWLDALVANGRLVLPLTASFAAPSAPRMHTGPMANLGKGVLVQLTKGAVGESFAARILTFVAIYSALGLRDDVINAELASALSRMPYPPLQRLRFDDHEATTTCWCHTARGCWSLA